MSAHQRGKLEETPLSYRTSKDGTVFLKFHGHTVNTLCDRAAERFLERIAALEPLEEQLVLAKLTGNFKRGNER